MIDMCSIKNSFWMNNEEILLLVFTFYGSHCHSKIKCLFIIIGFYRLLWIQLRLLLLDLGPIVYQITHLN